jgi:hypothetical protein
MARLPKVGEEAWGEVLNEYLLVAHNTDGTEREKNIGALAATVGLADLKTSNPSSQQIKGLLLSNDGTDLFWKQDLEINVMDYGAKGDGITDDTAAIQAAINAASGGGAITLPRGRFMVRQLKVRNKGTTIVGAARFGTQLVRLSGSDPLIDMSGSSTMGGHLRYCSLANLMLSGNGLPGQLVRVVYADNFVFRDVNFIHCLDTATDLTEVWDTRFESCAWEDCGSATMPATWLRNSQPAGTFGYSEDNTNQIHFVTCRWEGFRNGAVKLDGAANGSQDKLNGIFLVACKMESSVLAGDAFQIEMGTTVVYVNQLYMAMMNFDQGYATPVNAIRDSGTQIFMTNVYVQWGAIAGLANSVVHAVRGDPHMYHEFSTFYSLEDPVKATFWTEPEAGTVMTSCIWANRGMLSMGMMNQLIETSPDMGVEILLDAPASCRVTDHMADKELLKVDANATRPGLLFPNGTDAVGFSDAYTSEKWRITGAGGGAKFASGKFQIEPTKGYVGLNATPYTGISMLIRPAVEGDRGIAVVRPSGTSLYRLMEFQDETYNIQGMAIDSNGRPQAVGTPPRVTPGDQVSYANPRVQVRDIAGGVVAAVKASPAVGSIATITFSRAYAQIPLSIMLTNHSTTATATDLYVSDRTTTSFTVSTRTVPRGGSIVSFDYVVIA